jgi:hypothetical protein
MLKNYRFKLIYLEEAQIIKATTPTLEIINILTMGA